MVLLRLEAYNSGLEACIGTFRDIFGFLRFSAFIWTQEQDHFTLKWMRKLRLKLGTLLQNEGKWTLGTLYIVQHNNGLAHKRIA